MHERCYRPQHHAYVNYGGRGIGVCVEWVGYMEFRDWALANGWRRGLQINRINNDGNYSPDNCNLVTAKENGNNTRGNHCLTWQGRTLTIAQWAEETGINRRTLNNRIGHGWSVERALAEPARKLNRD